MASSRTSFLLFAEPKLQSSYLAPRSSTSESTTPKMSCQLINHNPNFIAILGGPGAGKGTQSALLTRHLASCKHLSIGALMRTEAANSTSPYSSTITENMRLGLVGPVTISVPVLKRHIAQGVEDGVTTFLLDGFPRRLDQVAYFQEKIGQISLVIVLDCPDEVLIERIEARNRGDDDDTSVRARVEMFRTGTQEVVQLFDEMGKVVRIPGEGTTEEVLKRVVGALRAGEEKGF